MSEASPKLKKRQTTQVDDAVLKLTLMRCVTCGGLIRLDSTAKLVFGRLAWRKRLQLPERELAFDLGVGVEAISQATRKLERCGLITNAYRNRGQRRWNEYHVARVEQILYELQEPRAARVLPEGVDKTSTEAVNSFARKSPGLPGVKKCVCHHPDIPDGLPSGHSASIIRTFQMHDADIPDAISKEPIATNG